MQANESHKVWTKAYYHEFSLSARDVFPCVKTATLVCLVWSFKLCLLVCYGYVHLLWFIPVSAPVWSSVYSLNVFSSSGVSLWFSLHISQAFLSRRFPCSLVPRRFVFWFLNLDYPNLMLWTLIMVFSITLTWHYFSLTVSSALE